MGANAFVRNYLCMFQTRMVNSLFKFTASHARGHGRKAAKEEDIDCAIAILQRKLEFLATLIGEYGCDFQPSAREQRYHRASEHFGERPFTADEYREAADISRATA